MITEVKTTVSTKEQATILGKQLLDSNLVVCVHTSAITSQYNWKGKYYEEDEYLISAKTTQVKKSQVIKQIQSNHPYDIPLITTRDLQLNESYKDWMDELL